MRKLESSETNMLKQTFNTYKTNKRYLAGIKLSPPPPQGSAETGFINLFWGFPYRKRLRRPNLYSGGGRVHCSTMLYAAVPSSTPICSCLWHGNFRYTRYFCSSSNRGSVSSSSNSGSRKQRPRRTCPGMSTAHADGKEFEHMQPALCCAWHAWACASIVLHCVCISLCACSCSNLVPGACSPCAVVKAACGTGSPYAVVKGAWGACWMRTFAGCCC